MKEILAGDGFCNFVEDLKINAKLTYKGMFMKYGKCPMRFFRG